MASAQEIGTFPVRLAAGNDPTTATGRIDAATPSPTGAVEDPRATYYALNVSGPWQDPWFPWQLAQATGGAYISGTVTTTNCAVAVWRVSGRVYGNTRFVITARNPRGTTDPNCNAWFKYTMTTRSSTGWSGSWTNAVGGSGTVTMTYKGAQPQGFVQVGSGVAKPNGVLHFDYSWGSSNGNLAELARCEVGENVVYPGANPYVWPRPPYNGSTPNPTILWVAANKGAAQDNHSHTAFIKPYKAAYFSARQQYRYRCPAVGTYVLPGWGAIRINRYVWDMTSKGCWTYRISKSGAEVRQRLPALAAGACAADLGQDEAMAAARSVPAGIAFAVDEPAPVGLGAPVVVDLGIANRGGREAGVDLGLDGRADLVMTVVTPDGRTVTRSLDGAGFGASGIVAVPAGETVKVPLLLNDWYAFSGQGTYRVTLSLGDPADPKAATATALAAKFTVTVGPRDSAALRRLAETLADRAIRSDAVADRQDAARMLAHVVDPVAVPSLVRVLKNGASVQTTAIAGLGRIGDRAARAALLAAQATPDEEIRAAARVQSLAVDRRLAGEPEIEPAD